MDIQAVAAAIAAARLVWLGLAERQWAMLTFLFVTTVSNLFFGLWPIQGQVYYWGYLTFQPVLLLVEIAVVFQLFQDTMSSYAGIQTAARRTLQAVVAISTLGSVTLTALSWDNDARRSIHAYYWLVVNHWVQFGLALMVIALILFLSRFPVRLARNTYVSCYFFCAVFLVEACDSLLATLSPLLFSRLVDMAAVLLVSVLLIAWTAMMRHQSADSVTEGVHFGNRDTGSLLLQLESLNQTLSRVGRQQ
jgi:hypothetical protein